MNVLSPNSMGKGHPASELPTFEYPATLLGNYSSYDSLKDAISNYLKGLAKIGHKCTFRELFAALNIPLFVTYSYHRRLIGQICQQINQEEYLANRPLIGALLCGETNGYITGTGFFDLMDFPEFCEGMDLDKTNIAHQAAFFGIQAQRCWLYWSKQRKAAEKRAVAEQLP